MYCRYSGCSAECAGQTVTLIGQPAFSASFMNVETCASIYYGGQTFVGTATGTRYTLSSNGVLNTNGGGTTYLPGNSAGSGTNSGTSPYGLYV